MTVLLTPQEVASRWRVDVKTLSNWRVKGRGPHFVKLGEGRNTRVLYRPEDIEAYELKHMKESRK